MDEEDAGPKIPLLAQLQAEDLDRMPMDELEDRLTRLKAEVDRVEKVIEAKRSTRSQAENIFKR